MKKSILNIEGVCVLSKKNQKTIQGAIMDIPTQICDCSCDSPTKGMPFCAAYCPVYIQDPCNEIITL